MIRLASRAAFVAAWLLLGVGLCLIALNPAVPSLQYAILWLGVMAVARGISTVAARLAVAIDLCLLAVCFFGLEIGGLILVPSVVAFTIGDALRPDGDPAS